MAIPFKSRLLKGLWMECLWKYSQYIPISAIQLYSRIKCRMQIRSITHIVFP